MTNASLFRHLRKSGFELVKNCGFQADWKKGDIVIRGPAESNVKDFNIGKLSGVLRKIDEANRIELQQKHTTRCPTHGELRPGQRVRTRHTFVDVPAGTVGTISEDYGSGFTVAWDRPGHAPLSDSFDKSAELQYLEIV